MTGAPLVRTIDLLPDYTLTPEGSVPAETGSTIVQARRTFVAETDEREIRQLGREGAADEESQVWTEAHQQSYQYVLFLRLYRDVC